MMAWRHIGVAVLAGSLVLGGARVQAAEPAEGPERIVPRVFITPLVVDGDLAQPARDELADSLAESLAQPGLELVAREELATHILRGAVGIVDRDFEIRIELRDRETDTVVAGVVELCELCGRTEAAETMTSLGLSLRRRVELALRPQPVVSVQSDPPGALVLLDGEPFGTTPVELPVRAGRHSLRITKAGFIAQTRSLDLVNGVRESLTVELQTIPESPQARRPVRAAVGWAAIGIGNVGTVTGVTLLALHGRPIRSKCHGSAVDGDGTCRYLHSTLVSGAIVGALGLSLLATGIALVVIERRRTPKPSTQARLGLGPQGPTLRF
jgi:hypothetical protein